jgi:predicted amidohydrolase YtcJ
VLTAGRLADVVVIDRDIRAIAATTIREARVVTTIVGGKVVFEAP